MAYNKFELKKNSLISQRARVARAIVVAGFSVSGGGLAFADCVEYSDGTGTFNTPGALCAFEVARMNSIAAGTESRFYQSDDGTYHKAHYVRFVSSADPQGQGICIITAIEDPSPVPNPIGPAYYNRIFAPPLSCTKPSTKNLKKKGICAVSAGEPIHVGTGDEWLVEVDYKDVHGLEFTRFYHSASNSPAGTFGQAWRHSYDGNVSASAASLVTDPSLNNPPSFTAWVTRANGEQLTFSMPAGSWVPGGPSTQQGWKSDADVNDQLASFTDPGGLVTGWQYTSQDGVIETFNGAGQLIAIVGLDGYTRTLSYSGSQSVISSNGMSSQLASVTDSFGRSLGFSYDSLARLISVNNSLGGAYQFAYDSLGNLSSVSYPDGTNRSYIYNEAVNTSGVTTLYNLTGIVDENGGRYSTITYDSVGRANSSVLSGGVDLTSISYNADGSSTITDALNTSRTTRLISAQGVLKNGGTSQPGGSGCSASSSATEYDANGNVVSQDDFNGVRSCFSYDLTRNLQTSRVDGLSNTTSCAPLVSMSGPIPAGSRKLSTVWHPDWQLRTQVAEPGKITTYVYNGQPDPFNGGAAAACAPASALLPNGLPIGVLCKKIEQATNDADGSRGFAATVRTDVPARQQTWTYNQVGQVLNAKGARTDVNDTTSYAYYAATGPSATQGDLQQSTNPLGQVTQFNAYNLAGQLLQRTDPNGLVTTYTYDQRQRPTSVSVGGMNTSYGYDAAGQLISTTLPDGTVNTLTYDGAHRLIQVADGAGNTVIYTLDAAGNRIGEQVQDSTGNLLKNITRSFDALSRLQGVTGDAR
jgi:YD repeat-containing protein